MHPDLILKILAHCHERWAAMQKAIDAAERGEAGGPGAAERYHGQARAYCDLGIEIRAMVRETEKAEAVA